MESFVEPFSDIIFHLKFKVVIGLKLKSVKGRILTPKLIVFKLNFIKHETKYIIFDEKHSGW